MSFPFGVMAFCIVFACVFFSLFHSTTSPPPIYHLPPPFYLLADTVVAVVAFSLNIVNFPYKLNIAVAGDNGAGAGAVAVMPVCNAHSQKRYANGSLIYNWLFVNMKRLQTLTEFMCWSTTHNTASCFHHHHRRRRHRYIATFYEVYFIWGFPTSHIRPFPPISFVCVDFHSFLFFNFRSLLLGERWREEFFSLAICIKRHLDEV